MRIIYYTADDYDDDDDDDIKRHTTFSTVAREDPKKCYCDRI
jgi:hypothetical protein